MEDNIKIFDECLKGTYQNEKLKPIINHLYEIVKKLEPAIIENCKKDMEFNNYEPLEEKIRKLKEYRIDQLLKIFNIIVDNNDPNIDEILQVATEDGMINACFLG